MKRFAKYIYIIKTILFIIQFYFVFVMLRNILDTKIFGILFIVFYLFLVIEVLYELLSKKQRYKNDYIYNLMQIGLIGYIIFISIKTTLAKVYVTRLTISYFNINFIVLSLLILFILIYNYFEFKSSKK